VLLAQGVVGVRAVDDLVQQNKFGFIRQLVFFKLPQKGSRLP
jgi:hypothetical protein